MKVVIKEGKTTAQEWTEGLYKDPVDDLWFFNSARDGICLTTDLDVLDFDEVNSEFGPLTYFTGIVTLTND